MLIIHKIFCQEYDTPEFAMVEYHCLDTLLFAGFIWIFRPREVPGNFTADLGDFTDNNQYINIYKSKISHLHSDDALFKKDDIEIPQSQLNVYKKDKNGTFPIIILNPTFGNSGATNKSPEYYSSITYKCDHLQIGYSKKE